MMGGCSGGRQVAIDGQSCKIKCGFVVEVVCGQRLLAIEVCGVRLASVAAVSIDYSILSRCGVARAEMAFRKLANSRSIDGPLRPRRPARYRLRRSRRRKPWSIRRPIMYFSDSRWRSQAVHRRVRIAWRFRQLGATPAFRKKFGHITASIPLPCIRARDQRGPTQPNVIALPPKSAAKSSSSISAAGIRPTNLPPLIYQPCPHGSQCLDPHPHLALLGRRDGHENVDFLLRQHHVVQQSDAGRADIAAECRVLTPVHVDRNQAKEWRVRARARILGARWPRPARSACREFLEFPTASVFLLSSRAFVLCHGLNRALAKSTRNPSSRPSANEPMQNRCASTMFRRFGTIAPRASPFFAAARGFATRPRAGS